MLLCEDHPMNVKVAARMLDKFGVRVDTAANGQLGVEAFTQSQSGCYDAILMDIRMPVLDGLAATRAIRALARPDARTIPIIAMSANASDEDVRKSLEAGMNAHMSKPIEPEKLYDTLAQHLGT